MFCVLDNDIKTFSYFKRYLSCFEIEGNVLKVDNQIQSEEIDLHLITNGFSVNDEIEKINWIKKNSQPFREYLNTIKLVYFICKVNNINANTLDNISFFELKERANKARFCLQNIY